MEMPCGYQIWSEELLTRAKCIDWVRGYTGLMHCDTTGQFSLKYPIATKFDQENPRREYSVLHTHSSRKSWHTINRLTGRTASKPANVS